jgi:ribonuclease D
MTHENDALTLPTREEIAGMMPFEGLALEQVHLVTTARQATSALDDLLTQPFLGFDTESRPTFRKGELSEGPHVLQFATRDCAYIFQTHYDHCIPAVAEILKSKRVAKIGFGLNDDLKRIAGKLIILPQLIVDLDHTFKKNFGLRNSIGAKTAIALLFRKRLIKSHKATTSNWANKVLTEKQLLYAANDAFAAYLVYAALKKNGIEN